MPYIYLFIFFIVSASYLLATSQDNLVKISALIGIVLGFGLAFMYRHKNNPRLQKLLSKLF